MEKKFRCNKHKNIIGTYAQIRTHAEKEGRLSRMIEIELMQENLKLL